MNKKQIIGLIVAALVFVGVGASSVVTNSVASKINDEREKEKDALTSIINLNEVSLPSEDFVGVVNIEGTIQNTSDSSSIFGSSESYDHKQTLKYIDAMKNSKNNKGIILNVNSPGGGVYESDELYLKLKEYKEQTGRKIWTYMNQQACSGGYYISMASDEIYANRNTWTGSIGVIMSLTNVKDLYDKIGIKEVDITSGPNKAIGSSGAEMTEEQRAILQSMVDESYEQFVGIVAEGRNMDVETVKPIADGRVYTAKQALELNLIDKIDTYEQMQQDVLKEVGQEVTIYTPKKEESIISSLFSKAENLKEKTDAQVISDYLKEKGNGGLMYYAKLQ